MNKLNDILDAQVSFQKDAFSELSHVLKIRNVLKGIKEKRLDNKISSLRTFLNNNDKESYNKNKKTLPGVTFCATFKHKRRKENIEIYNSIIVIDIDKLSDDELVTTKKHLLTDDYVFSFWDSPSNIGVKGLVKVKYSFPFEKDEIDTIHKSAFKKLVEYFDDKYGIELDESGSDTTRLCFLSSDDKLVMKENFKPFELSETEIITVKTKPKKSTSATKEKIISHKNALFNPEGRNKPTDRKTIQSIYKFLSKRKLSITSSYENWYKVALAISTAFTHDIGENYFLKLCRLDGAKHNEIESKNLLISCYENSKGEITFNTIFHLAKELGYKNNKESSSEGG